jgi:hypothetical protein
LAGNLVKPLLSLYGTEWRERGYGLRKSFPFSRAQMVSYLDQAQSATGDGGREQLISNAGRFKPAFVERDKKQTMTDLRGISTDMA